MTRLIRHINMTIEEGLGAFIHDLTFGTRYLDAPNDYPLDIILKQAIKRIIDFTVSSFCIVFAFPFFIVIGTAIKLTSKGPVFFKQERIGYRGKKFMIWKFRTMSVAEEDTDHQAYIQKLLENADEEGNEELIQEYMNHVQNRVTKIGCILRKTSLDEIPQLFNIFLGEMSIAGPRPHPTYEVAEYKDWYRRRLHVKPGLTGWSKLNLRLTPQNYEESILYDLWYVDQWSLWLDIKIILKTIPFVLSMKDAK